MLLPKRLSIADGKRIDEQQAETFALRSLISKLETESNTICKNLPSAIEAARLAGEVTGKRKAQERRDQSLKAIADLLNEQAQGGAGYRGAGYSAALTEVLAILRGSE